MFSEINRALIAGRFICPYTMKEGYDYLLDENRLDHVNDYLGRIDLRVTKTIEGTAFYATSMPGTSQARRDVKHLFTTIKHELRPMVQFLTLAAAAVGSDMVLAPGYFISKAKFIDAINGNPSLQTDLRALTSGMRGTGADGSNSALLEKVLRKVTEYGYIHLSNPQKEIYEVTGKIDYFHEVCEFIIEHEKIEEIEAGDAQEALL